MKIKEIEINLLYTTQEFIAHGTNCQGVMGAGVAFALRTKFPKMFEKYRELCDQNKNNTETLLGTIQTVSCDNKTIINCFTQLGYGTSKQQVDYEAIRKCFKALNEYAKENKISEIVMPRVGSGLGGGDWDIIKNIIEEESVNFQAIVCVKNK
jgi:O-acetyl-ADP-ribose deacetylase (regulator of RNase III)